MGMLTEEIRAQLFSMQDVAYRDLQSKLIPNVEADAFIGVRTPELRRYAKQLAMREDVEQFLDTLPHRYFDENQLHAFILSEIRDFDRCIEGVCRFLPYVDNWATCDQMTPKVFKRHRDALMTYIRKWIGSGETYSVRFAIGMLMAHFLDGDFDKACLDMVAEVRSEAYYVNMMRAWYFATALAKQYEAAVPYMENRRLDAWTHNRTIQKSVESFRISPERKEYLKSLRIKDGQAKPKSP